MYNKVNIKIYYIIKTIKFEFIITNHIKLTIFQIQRKRYSIYHINYITITFSSIIILIYYQLIIITYHQFIIIVSFLS